MFADVVFADSGIRWVTQAVFQDPLLRGPQRKRVERLRLLASKRARDGSAALTRCGILFEEVVRIWLSQYFRVSYNRVLSWKQEEYDAALEIDGAVYDAHENPDILLEVGFSVTGWKAIRKKCKQLRRALGVAQRRWPDVRGCVVLVHAGLQEVEPEPELTDGLVLDREAFQIALDVNRFAVLVLKLEQTWQFAREVGVPLCAELREQVREAALEWRREFLH